MLSPVIKVVDPQVNFLPSDLQEKICVDPAGIVAAFYAAEAKKQKQEEIRKCAQNWCLI